MATVAPNAINQNGIYTGVNTYTTGANTYTVAVEDANGCVESQTLSVYVNTITPSFTITPSTLCLGQTVTLTTNANISYASMPLYIDWGDGSGVNNYYTQPQTYTYPTVGNYTVIATGFAGGCLSTYTQAIQVLPAGTTPTISISPSPQALCVGSCATYTASGALTYTWSTGATTATVTLCPTVTTTYSVQGTNACGNTAVKYITIGVTPLQGPIPAFAVPNPICPGAVSHLLTNGATSYTWMPGNFNGSNYPVFPLVTTSYTVFGTNGCGTSSAVATVSVLSNVQPTVSIGQSTQYPCLGSSMTLTANAMPVGTYTYNWSAPINQTGQVVTFNPTENANYFCTVTDVCGNVGSNKTCISVVSNKCCIPGGEILNNITLTGTNPGSNFTGFIVKIFNTITITGNVTWTNSEFKMQQGSKIVIMPGGKLTLSKCQLYSCADMWQGIILQAGSGSVTPMIVVNNSSIEDAWKAIHYDAQNGNWSGNILSNTSTFNKNYIGISVENINNMTSLPGIIEPVLGDKFDGTVSLNSPGNYLKCSSFYTPTIKGRPYAGVFFNNQLINLHIGDESFNAVNTNTFTNMDYGIYTKNSTVRSFGNKFTNLTGTNLSSFPPIPGIGIGVYAVNTTTTLNHQLDVAKCTFTNVWRGVDVSNINTFVVDNCTLTCSSTSNIFCTNGCIGNAGVISTNAINDAHVINSYFSNYNTGIFNFYSIPTIPSYTFGVGQNTITATSTGFCSQAISIQAVVNSYTTSPASISVVNNQLSNVRNGILSNNLKSGLRMSNNTVNLQYATIGNRYGIRCTGTENAWIDNNTVNGGGIGNVNLSGIYMQLSPNCKTQCNTITNSGNCVVYQGNNQSNTVGFANNSMSNSGVGLKLTNSGVIGNQGNSGFIFVRRNSGNTWNGTFSNFKTFTFNSTAQTSKLFVLNSGTTLPGPATSNGTTAGLSIDRYGVSPAVTPPTLLPQFAFIPITCPIPLMQAARLAPVQPLNDLAQLAAQDSALVSLLTNTTAITSAAQYLQKEFVFALLKRPQVTTTNMSLQNFALANINTGLGHYLAIDSLIKNGQYALAQTKNSTAVITTNIEQNKNDINTQLLNKLLNDTYAYTASEVQLVETIANKCPLTDGNGVYQARTLLQIIKNQYMEFTDSCDADKPNGARISLTDEEGNTDVEQFAESFLIFPNPNNGNMQVLYNLNSNKQAKINIFDVNGKIIISKAFDNETNLMQLNINVISNGVYYYQIIGDKSNILKSDKLIIIN
jgi:hypothetical protein